ncbi:MAG: hypothetical protein OJI67_13935, partial [Prosthecobacter sp.]|nr:hypothetical protein [Prosthecobacter sp.]
HFRVCITIGCSRSDREAGVFFVRVFREAAPFHECLVVQRTTGLSPGRQPWENGKDPPITTDAV